MKRASLFDASQSRQPARCIGWLAAIATGRPPMRAKPTIAFFAKCSCTSKKLPASTVASITLCMS